MKEVTATQDGFYRGQRVKKGQTFPVGDNVTGKWFVLKDEYEAPQEPVLAQVVSNAARREAESFTTLMKKLPKMKHNEKSPDTMSGINASGPKLPPVAAPKNSKL